jgi:hypothetical protein
VSIALKALLLLLLLLLHRAYSNEPRLTRSEPLTPVEPRYVRTRRIVLAWLVVESNRAVRERWSVSRNRNQKKKSPSRGLGRLEHQPGRCA